MAAHRLASTWAFIAGLLGLLLTAPSYAAKPAPGGHALLDGAESATTTVVGRVSDRARVDQHAYMARLQVERVLFGSVSEGERLRFAWEELSAKRPPRFGDGDRIVVALYDKPRGSIWYRRFPDISPTNRVYVVASSGDAFLHNPDEKTLELLGRYLALPAAQRREHEGVRLLAEHVAGAHPAVARAAVEKMASVEGLSQSLDGEAIGHLAAMLEKGRVSSDASRALLELVAKKKLTDLRAVVATRAVAGDDLEAAALVALAELDGGIDEERFAVLITRKQPEIRAIAARFAPASSFEKQLPRVLKSDASANVRAAAATRLAERGGEKQVDLVLAALDDRDGVVRLAAARSLGARRPAPTTKLEKIAFESSSRAQAAVLALSFAGPPGKEVLRKIAATHPREELRNLAFIALGKIPEHH